MPTLDALIKITTLLYGVFQLVFFVRDNYRISSQSKVEGKNEIDSAFGHIARIPALDLTSASNIAENYWAEQLMLLGYRLPIDPHKQITAELDRLYTQISQALFVTSG